MVQPDRPKKAKKSDRRGRLIAAALVVVIGTGGFFLWQNRQQPGEIAAVPDGVGFVSLNVVPWAELKRIEDAEGNDIAFKEGTTTPCRLSLAEGTYDIHLANPHYQDPLVITVAVKDGEIETITRQLPGFDPAAAAANF